MPSEKSKKIRRDRNCMGLNGRYELLTYADVNLLGENSNIMEKHRRFITR
jgi:hypothetical protein